MFDRIKNMASAIGGMMAPAPESQSVDELISILQQGSSGVGNLPVDMSPAEVRKSFRRWLYAAVNGIASAVAMIPWHVEQLNRDGKWEAVEQDHPLLELLQTVNPNMTGPELLYWAVAELRLVGQSFWKITAFNGMNEPTELVPLVGSMKVKALSDEGVIESWEHRVALKGRHFTETLLATEVVYLRYPKPGALFEGYGPGQASSSSVRLDQQIVESEWAAFKQGIFPFAILMMNERNPAKRRKLLTAFNEAYAGAQNTGKAVAMSKEMNLKWPTTTARDMGYTKGSRQARDEIFSAHGHPAAISGLAESVNRASAEGMEYIYSKWTVFPVLRFVEARINQDLTWRHFDTSRRTRFRFENPVPADKAADQTKRDSDIRSGVITINEARADDGREPVPWGDVPIMPNGVSPLGEAPPEKEQVARVEQARGARAVRGGVSRAKRREIAVGFARDRLALEKRLRRVYAGAFRSLAGRVIEAWGAARPADQSAGQVAPAYAEASAGRHVTLALPPEVDRLLDPTDFARELARKAKPANRQGLVLGGSWQRDRLPDPTKYDWRDGTDAIDRYAARFAAHHYVDIARVTRERLTEAIAAGVAEHETWDEIKLRIVLTFGPMAESRAASIAQTETTKLFGSGGQAFREEFVIAKKQWVASGVNTRETHQAADGQTVKNDEMFSVGLDQMMFPGDGQLAEENCNCACCAIPIVE